MAVILENIIRGIACENTGSLDIPINKIAFDSRLIAPGDLFVAIRGSQSDGHSFITQVIEAGCAAIICETLPENIVHPVVYIKVKDSKQALGIASANFFGNPSREIKLLGVTGTNGKTSIATLLHKMFTGLDVKAGLFSTVRNLIGQVEIAATHTTPDSVSLHSLLRKMADAGCTHVFMEVSSHAIDQQRIAGLDFDIAVFSNITHDHLDYHGTFDKYIKAKKQFFDELPEKAIAIVNADDKRSKVMVQNTRATVKTFGLKSIADFKGKIIENHFDGMLLSINNVEVWTKIIGEFNASNLLAVYASAVSLGYPQDEILRLISSLNNVEGRFEYLRSNTGITAIIDYAHTPDALQNVLGTINQIQSQGQLITVVGAGGNRDKTKRPVMGKIAATMSGRVIFTSDNPRDEEPQDIISQMMDGVPMEKRVNVLAITDRREAIRTACMLAHDGDVILIAGKGHETYQEIRGKKNYFSDKQVVAEVFMVNKINLQ
jgi:UDP-N-acetylmuramoyl-L-alanyl-D-glutamate--2,6-diaminopimelate ligase